MSNKLTIKPLPPELVQKQQEAEVDFRVGDMFFVYNDDDCVIRIREINKWSRAKNRDYTVSYDHALDWEATEWGQYGSDEFESFLQKVKSGHYVKLVRPLSELRKEAADLLDGKTDIAQYEHNQHEDSLNEERGLIGRTSKDSLTGIQKVMEEKRRSAELIAAAVGFEMERRKQELEAVKDRLYGAVAKFEKQIAKIRRTITTIELYLGIEEELHQIQEGEPAPQLTPISFRQLVLFIDEEVGSHEQGGLDFRNVEDFDEWLLQPGNMDIVLPEQKGVVVLKPRRNKKEYHDDWLNVVWNVNNRIDTYLLIRNGQNVYRVFSERLVISDRLFPRRNELQELLASMEAEDSHLSSREKEAIEDEMFQYRKRAVLMQGLLDRSTVFHPLPVDRLNIFHLEEHQDAVRFIYDDEATLPSGRPTFKDWKKKLNEGLTHGSRILITSAAGSTKGRIFFYCNEHNYPPRPEPGIYQVERYKSPNTGWCSKDMYDRLVAENKLVKLLEVDPDHYQHLKDDWQNMKEKDRYIVEPGYRCDYIKEYMTILYNPGDEVMRVGWDYDPHERKKRICYTVKASDDFVLLYDQLDVNDIDFYLKSRVDRPHYLGMMPILKEVKQFLLEEQAKEMEFEKLVMGQVIRQLEETVATGRIQETIAWWKYKNKIKRPLSKDDTLALRMIVQRVTSKNYDKLKRINA